MGTRNLTMLIKDGQTRIAQYGQWDGYPDGQGLTALEFLSDPKNIENLKEKLKNVRFYNEQDNEERKSFCKSIGIKDGLASMTQVAQINEKYPFDSRDYAAEILKLIADSNGDVLLSNGEDFAGDSLFCEWAYVVDLDKNTFEVYEGFNKEPLDPSERFYSLTEGRENKEYYPVKHKATWALDALPSKEDFLAAFVEKPEQEDAF